MGPFIDVIDTLRLFRTLLRIRGKREYGFSIMLYLAFSIASLIIIFPDNLYLQLLIKDPKLDAVTAAVIVTTADLFLRMTAGLAVRTLTISV